MTANIFGSSFKTVRSNQKYIDSKFITLSQNLQLKVDKTGDKMQGELDMSCNKITNLGEPSHNFDVASKKYVDENFVNLYTLNTTGLIPQHITLIDATGFVVNTSSNHGNNHAGNKVFNPANKTSWRVTSDTFTTTNFWIEIECPFEVSIYRFSIQPAENTKLIKWKIQGCMDAYHLWEDLPFILEVLEGNTTKIFTLENPKLAKGYWCYRIFIEEAEGINPGLTYWQLYTVNNVFSQ
jgi:hypothetical protein